MFVGAPANKRPEIRQDGIVQKRDIDALQDRPHEQNQQRNDHKFGAIGLPNQRGVTLQDIHNAAHVGDQPNFHHGHDNGHDAGYPKHPLKRLRIGHHERPQFLRRCVLLSVIYIWVNEAFEKAQHIHLLSV